MEFKFCPECGTPRQGPFCGGCGFSFGGSGSSQTPSPESVIAQETLPTPAEDIVGFSVVAPSFPVPFGMVYAEQFDETECCWNCGAEHFSGECELCGFRRP